MVAKQVLINFYIHCSNNCTVGPRTSFQYRHTRELPDESIF